MSDSPQYEAFRAFARSEIRAARLELKAELAKELKDEFRETLTREAPKELNIDDLERRVWEKVAPKIPTPPTFEQPKDGRDAVGIAGVTMRSGDLVLRLTDGTEQNVGRVTGEKGDKGDPGNDGKDSTAKGDKGDPGEPGADGIATREELNALVEERVAEIQVRTFADVYQGVYENGRLYERGLLTTWGGSLWLSQAETRSKPGESAEWKLVVKKGADARK